MNNLAEVFSFSELLARRWAQFTPQMELAWNPRDGESATFAAHKWLTYVSQNLFPVSAGGIDEFEELDDMLEPLRYIFPETMGFDTEEVNPNDLEGADRILCLFSLVHNGYGEQGLDAIEELYALDFTITPDSNLEIMCRMLDEWLTGGCLPEDEYGYWEGCIALMRYYLNDTGSDYLNLSYVQLYSGGYEMLYWTPENIETLRADWAVAQALLEKMNTFRAWYKENESYVLAVLLDLNEDITGGIDEEE